MPLQYVQRWFVPQTFKVGGTQYVDGVLTFSGPTTIVLSDGVFGETGDYILFDYSAGSFPGGQAELDANVTPYIDDTALGLSGFGSLTDDTANKRVVLSLLSNPTNGKQFVDGDLTIADGASWFLSSSLYATANTYEVVEVTGTVTATLSGGSPNYLTGLSIYSLAGKTVVGGYAYLDGNIIKVTLA